MKECSPHFLVKFWEHFLEFFPVIFSYEISLDFLGASVDKWAPSVVRALKASKDCAHLRVLACSVGQAYHKSFLPIDREAHLITPFLHKNYLVNWVQLSKYFLSFLNFDRDKFLKEERHEFLIVLIFESVKAVLNFTIPLFKGEKLFELV